MVLGGLVKIGIRPILGYINNNYWYTILNLMELVKEFDEGEKNYKRDGTRYWCI